MGHPARKADVVAAAFDQMRAELLKEAEEAAERKVRELLGRPANSQEGSEVLKIRAAASVCGVSVRTIHNWIKKGLPFSRAGTDLRFRRSELQEWMDRNGSGRR